MKLQSSASYARALKPFLPARIRLPAPSRLLLLPVHYAVIGFGMWLLAKGVVPWFLTWVVSLVIGGSFAGLTFLAHETLHGSVTRGRRLQTWIGWLSFLPFATSPVLWRAWHNRAHHGKTNLADVDPDSYPTLELYMQSPSVRFVTRHFAPGNGVGGILALLIGFSVQSLHMLFAARGLNLLSPRLHRLAIVHTLLAVGVWTALAINLGWAAFAMAFLLPLVIANVIVMGYILTNHTLSPLTSINDPLVNSLTVTVPRWAEWLTLGFGYHVEHHLYPGMSSRHARQVSELLKAHWPDRYQSMPLTQALVTLFRTARVYKNATTIMNVTSRQEWPTLGSAPTSVSNEPVAIAATAQPLVQSAHAQLSEVTAPDRGAPIAQASETACASPLALASAAPVFPVADSA